MIIQSLHIASFGGLEDFTLDLADGANILIGPNESGKSSVAAFVKFIFYGLSSRAGKSGVSERARYLNSRTGTASGYLLAKAGDGVLWRIERSLTSAGERIRIVNQSSGEILTGEEPGMHFFGVPEDVFTSTCFVSQVSVRPESPVGQAAGGTRTAVENLLASADENVDIRRAEKQLDDLRRELSKRNGGGEIAELKERRAALLAERNSSAAKTAEILSLSASLDDIRRRIGELEEDRARHEGIFDALEKITLKRRIDAADEAESQLSKLKSTYIDALPQLINPKTGRIHSTFTQTITATGRLSSLNPNLQNIPVRNDEGREIRRAFIPAEGNVFFSADYSQIELRLVADLSGDATMLDAFAHDQDIHALTAARIYHEELTQVTADQRRKAKTANFGILYGISAFGLAERLSIPRSEAKMLIDGYFATFPGVRDYIDRSVAQARERGYVTTLDGRRRMLPDINSRNAVVRSFSERNAVNAPIQGTAADIIKRAMIGIHRRFEQEGIRSQMILQVHDELNFDVIPAELDRVERIVIEEMESAYKGRVRLTASHAAADNWLDAH